MKVEAKGAASLTAADLSGIWWTAGGVIVAGVLVHILNLAFVHLCYGRKKSGANLKSGGKGGGMCSRGGSAAGVSPDCSQGVNLPVSPQWRESPRQIQRGSISAVKGQTGINMSGQKGLNTLDSSDILERSNVSDGNGKPLDSSGEGTFQSSELAGDISL
jgi:hypothetical protein